MEPSRSLNPHSLPIPVVVPLVGTGQLPSFRSHDFFPAKTANSSFPPRMNRNFMKFMDLNYPWILKQTFPTFGTVISVADSEQDDVEMDWE
jgi:hypothetical protein